MIPPLEKIHIRFMLEMFMLKGDGIDRLLLNLQQLVQLICLFPLEYMSKSVINHILKNYTSSKSSLKRMPMTLPTILYSYKLFPGVFHKKIGNFREIKSIQQS